MKQRLDTLLVARGICDTRSEASNWIRLGSVMVDSHVITKSGHMADETADIRLAAPERYVSRAGLKLASVAARLAIDFAGAIVLDVGSSTGGFTDYALQHGAQKVVAVDVGTDQLHPRLRQDPRVELHEKTDIRNVGLKQTVSTTTVIQQPDIVVIDVSFISLRQILPSVAALAGPATQIVAMVKPQFEAGKQQTNKGIIKNDRIRRDILHDFEAWAKQYFIIRDKADSHVAGAGGNRERFYVLVIQSSKA